MYSKTKLLTKLGKCSSAKRKVVVRENAKGNRPQAARELTEEEEDKLFRLGEFGDNNPEALQRTVWWLLSLIISVFEQEMKADVSNGVM